MMKRLMVILVVGLLFTMNACITVKESYQFKKNGSGMMEYILDMSEMSSLMEMAGENGAGDSGDLMGDQSDTFDDLEKSLNDMSGISKVKQIKDDKNYIYGIKFKFKNIDALNKALNKMLVDDAFTNHQFFKMDKGVITRTHIQTNNMDMGEILGEDEDSEMAATFLESMKYQLHFEFKNDVKAVYASDADINSNQVDIEVNFMDVAEDVSALNTSIVLE